MEEEKKFQRSSHENGRYDVSVIVPIYRVEKSLLERCLFSIWKQTEKRVQTILVFDETTDVYRTLTEEFQSRGMELLAVERDHGGVSAARNKGIELAKGRWIAFVDADDWLEEGALAVMCRLAEEQQADVVMGEHLMEYGAVSKAHSYLERETVFEGERRQKFEQDVLKPQTGAGFVWGKLFDRKFLFENHLLFDERLSAAEDAEFMFRVSGAAGKICYMTQICYHYWFNTGSAVRRYQKDYVDKYLLSMEAIKNDLDGAGNREYCREAYDSCVLYHLLLMVVNYSFHPQSGKTAAQQTKEFKELLRLPIFAQPLEHIHYNDFSKTRQITLWCIRMKWYFAVRMIAKIRHRQFRTYS